MNAKINLPSLSYPNERNWNLFMLVVLIGLLILAWLSSDLNFAHSTGTQSRALYVDEGFYSDAAQNLVKTGHWEVEHDSRHWPGSPLTLVLQSVAFSLFGASTTVARMLSVILGLIGLWALYSIAKTRFIPGISALLVLVSISPITYITVARSALTDSTAMTMSLLAMWVFCCMERRHYAIPLSLGFAFLAFFSKMYYLFAFATLITVWLGELIVVPLLTHGAIKRKLLLNLLLSIGVIGLFYLVYRLIFAAEISNYMAINANKKPQLDLAHLFANIRLSFFYIPLHTRSQTFFNILVISVSYAIVHFVVIRLFFAEIAAGPLTVLRRIRRVDWVMGTFLVSGLITVGTLELHKAHYSFFAILPFAFVSVALIYQQLPKKLATYLSMAILLIHGLAQEIYYPDWLGRPQNTSIVDSSENMVERILSESPAEGLIPVIGEYSAQLGLYSDRIISIDAKWLSRKELCQRIEYWKPRYHVNVVWPKSRSTYMAKKISQCPGVNGYQEIARYHTFATHKDYLVLNRFDYNDNEDSAEKSAVIMSPIFHSLDL